jgi:ribosomal protein S18 acetylase RimI-like enzyme
MQTLRRAEPADAPAIAALTREAYAKWVPVIGREPLPMRADYEAAVASHRFDLLYVGEILAALIETTPRDDSLLIVNVAVDPAFQGQGHGRRLLALAEDLAASAGLSAMRLYTNQRFEENLRLYGTLGYRVEREETSNLGVTVFMVKPLAARRTRT